jgi:hypothetical protein
MLSHGENTGSSPLGSAKGFKDLALDNDGLGRFCTRFCREYRGCLGLLLIGLREATKVEASTLANPSLNPTIPCLYGPVMKRLIGFIRNWVAYLARCLRKNGLIAVDHEAICLNPHEGGIHRVWQ